jgi:hypothetical protein
MSPLGLTFPHPFINFQGPNCAVYHRCRKWSHIRESALDLVFSASNDTSPSEHDHSICARNPVHDLHGVLPARPLAGDPRDVDSLQQSASNGVWGGCQAVYTMYPSQNTGCSNLTLPTQSLDVDAIVQDGPISRYGWIPQVRELSCEPLTVPLTCLSVFGHFVDP